MAARREACGLFSMDQLPTEAVSAALLAYLLHRQARCEARVESIAAKLDVPPVRHRRWRGALLVIGAILFALCASHSQRAREVVVKVWANFAQR